MPSILIEDLLSRIDHRSYRERKYVLPPNVDHHARQSTSVDPILRPNWRRPVNTTAQTREEGPILDEHSSPPEHRATHAMDRDETTTTTRPQLVVVADANAPVVAIHHENVDVVVVVAAAAVVA